MKHKLLEIIIRFLERDLKIFQKATLTPEQEDGMLSLLWENSAFRNYVADRNLKIMYNLAGGQGMDPEPRDKYLMKMGQRVENLILAAKAKAANKRVLAKIREKKKS